MESLFSKIPKKFAKIGVISDTLQALDRTFIDMESKKEQVENDFTLNNVSEINVGRYEAILGEKNPGLTIEERRKKLVAKYRGVGTATPSRVARIISGATGTDVSIVENVSAYTFSIQFKNADILNINFLDLLEEAKPAHLAYILESVIDNLSTVYSLYVQGYSNYPLCSDIPSGRWPYQQNVISIVDMDSLGELRTDSGVVELQEAAKVLAAPKGYVQYIYATRADQESVSKTSMNAQQAPVNFITLSGFNSGEYPSVSNEAVSIYNQLETTEMYKANSSNYNVCGVTLVGGARIE